MSSGVPADGTTSGRLRRLSQAQTSRRAMLRRGGVAAAASIAGLTLLDQRRAQAATGEGFTLGQANNANTTTSLSVTTADTTLGPLLLIDGSELSSTSTTLVVNGPAGGGVALQITSSSSAKMPGLAVSATGAGAAGGVVGSSGSGTGVTGTSKSGTAVVATSSSGDGLKATGTRGGVFAGTISQVRLTPAKGPHPHSGFAGDLFVDHDNDLWFCKGGTHWVKLA
jgi:hypothetical protein